MKMLPEQIEAWDKVAALRDELAAAEARIEAIDQERQGLVRRAHELRDGYRSPGEISHAVRAAKRAGLPILKTAYSDRIIVRVEARWIVFDGYSASSEAFYDRTTGRRKGIRSDYDMVDTTAALAAWDEYQKRLEAFGLERKSE